MLPKKNSKADLESGRILFLQTGFIAALALVLLAFEWNSRPDNTSSSYFSSVNPWMEEEMISTPRVEEIKEPEIVKPKLVLEINPVDNKTETGDTPDMYIENTITNQDIWKNGFETEEEKIIETYSHYTLEQKPLFNGGDPLTEFGKYIYRNIVYPEEAIKNGIEGRVVLQFVIDETGKLTEVSVLGSIHPVLDSEAVRVVNLSPRWTPGKQGISNVRVLYQFPVNFRLN
jgi:periplasmic protein TonB